MTRLDSPLWSPREVSELIGVSTGTLRSWRERLDGPQWLKAGKLIRYAPSDVEAWLSVTNDHRDFGA
jgi:predicted DNA-binding transcriptional regulator AlpA